MPLTMHSDDDEPRSPLVGADYLKSYQSSQIWAGHPSLFPAAW